MSIVWIKDGKIIERPTELPNTKAPTDEQIEKATNAKPVKTPDCDRKYWTIEAAGKLFDMRRPF